MKPRCFLIVMLMHVLWSPWASATELQAEDITGFELISASACEKGLQCAYGHTLLRIVMKARQAHEDLVLSVTTNAPEPTTFTEKFSFLVKSITGLPMTVDVSSMGTTFLNYSINQKRGISRLPLQMNDRNKQALVKNINKLFFTPDNLLSQDELTKRQTAYNSLFNNCAGEIVRLLNESGFPSESFGIAMPGNLPAHLYRTYIALYPSIATSPYESFESQFKALPESFYQLCDNPECASEVVQNFSRYWSGTMIEFPVYERPENDLSNNSHGLWVRSEPAHWNNMKPVIQKHFELLLNFY